MLSLAFIGCSRFLLFDTRRSNWLCAQGPFPRPFRSPTALKRKLQLKFDVHRVGGEFSAAGGFVEGSRGFVVCFCQHPRVATAERAAVGEHGRHDAFADTLPSM